MTSNVLNNIFNNLLTLNEKTLDAFFDDVRDTYKDLKKDGDIDSLKVLRNQLQTIRENQGDAVRKKSKDEYRRLVDIIDDINELIAEFEKQTTKEVVLVDVVKKYRKKNAPLTELPPEKEKTHQLIAIKKSDIAYEEEMLMLQLELVKLQKYIGETGQKLLIIFEGRDAAGKWGNIKRFMENLNPRSAKVVALMKPTDVEKWQWYFQRYISHLPNAGEMVFFDRSWYNRAGVEPVMGFVGKADYESFMLDAPELEKMLVKSAGIKIIKFYFSVSKSEQAARFEERRTNPLKQFKLSPIDQFSQKLWDRYTVAEYENLSRTHTDWAPWTIVNSDDKEASRINAMKYILSQFNYPDKIKAEKLKIDDDIILSGEEKAKILKKEVEGKKGLFE
jgi:polyphosphate kinase 2